jgi:hypothetical protein
VRFIPEPTRLITNEGGLDQGFYHPKMFRHGLKYLDIPDVSLPHNHVTPLQDGEPYNRPKRLLLAQCGHTITPER